MSVEIERKFLVAPDWRPEGSGTRYRQGYLAASDRWNVRVRIAGSSGKLTVKSARSGLSRQEFEYDIPLDDAEQMLARVSTGVIDKVRHLVEFDGKIWEVDVFHGDNEGLVLAEIELSSEDEAFEAPGWLGKEVSAERRYYNAALAEVPFSCW